MAATYIVVKRTITITTKIPHGDYSDLEPEEAAQWERDQPLGEKIQAFVEALDAVDFDDGSATLTGDLDENVEVLYE